MAGDRSALDNHKYDQALDYFTEVVARGGPKADGALYWKAYTLNKLGRRDEAAAAIAQLRTSFPSSHWLDDAKALELEVKQASGKPVSPESESDDDLKLMALNGLAQTDPARAFPLLDKLLKGPASPKLKKNAIYVLAINTHAASAAASGTDCARQRQPRSANHRHRLYAAQQAVSQSHPDAV